VRLLHTKNIKKNTFTTLKKILLINVFYEQKKPKKIFISNHKLPKASVKSNFTASISSKLIHLKQRSFSCGFLESSLNKINPFKSFSSMKRPFSALSSGSSEEFLKKQFNFIRKQGFYVFEDK